jgi:hypothetical protein
VDLCDFVVLVGCLGLGEVDFPRCSCWGCLGLGEVMLYFFHYVFHDIAYLFL